MSGGKRLEPELVGDVTEIAVIAVGNSIRELARLEKAYGKARWRKLKGVALVRLPDDSVHKAEVHGYEGHGIGRREVKINRILD